MGNNKSIDLFNFNMVAYVTDEKKKIISFYCKILKNN